MALQPCYDSAKRVANAAVFLTSRPRNPQCRSCTMLETTYMLYKFGITWSWRSCDVTWNTLKQLLRRARQSLLG